MKMMIPIILAAMCGANLYVLYRVWHLIPAGSFLRPVWAAFVVVAVAAFFGSFLLSGKIPSGAASALYRLGTAWFFMLLYLTMIFMVLDLVRITHLLPLGRFMFGSWTGLGAVAALMAVIFTAGYLHYRNKERVELHLENPAGIPLENPLKIVAISDLHLGYNIGKREFSRWVELINRENPDLVLIAGDAIDNSIVPLSEQDAAAVFRRIASRHGVFMALGNHEYIAGANRSLAFLESAGITVLRDSAALIDRSIYLVGRDDRSNPRRKTLSELTDTLDRSRPVILLDHQPYHLEEAQENGIALQLSGHTHRGQVWPVTWITDKMFELSHGYEQKGNTHFYVSSGLGLWGGKFRIGSRSEYVVIYLK